MDEALQTALLNAFSEIKNLGTPPKWKKSFEECIWIYYM